MGSSKNASLNHLNDVPSKFSCLVIDGHMNNQSEDEMNSNTRSNHYDIAISGDFDTDTIIDHVFEGERPASGSTHIQFPLSSIEQSSNVIDLSTVSGAFLIHGKEQEKSRRISKRDIWI